MKKKLLIKTSFFKKIPLPKSMVFIFIFMAILAVYGILRDSADSGLRPFGFVSEVFAQFTTENSSVTNPTTIPENLFQIIDSYGRCQVVNPDSNNKIRRLADVGNGNGLDLLTKAGLNQGDSGQQGTQMEFLKNKDLNMSYLLTLVTSPGDSGSAVGFIKDVYDNGYMPIVRLCFDGGCGFDISGSADSIIGFYQAINSELAGTEYQYIGVVGPNEPGTGSEMAGFKVSDYGTLVTRANQAAFALQDSRVENGGNMYIAPAIFNLSNRSRDDAKEYLTGNGHEAISPDLYDYLLGNTYDLPDGSAVKWYEESGAKRYITEHSELVMVFTEFGYFPGSGSNISTLKESYKTLCEDETVDGIMFFRPDYPELPVGSPRQDPPISASDMKKIIDSCDTPPTKLSKRNSSWLNCNFDSCISKDYQYSAQSIATPVAEYIPDQSDKKAWISVSCTNNQCTAQQQNTMQISLPIKSLGSTTASNTAKFRSYPPACASIAAQYGNNIYDALNQFAGKLTASDNSEYPMPWLGSLINCMSQLALSLPEFAGDPTITNSSLNIHPFSIASEAKIETQSDLERNLTPASFDTLDWQTISQDGKAYVPDEKTVCTKNKETGVETCFDNKSLDLINSLRTYNPFDLAPNYYSISKNSGDNLIYVKNSDDFLQGPEVKTNSSSKTFSGSDICWTYGQRNLNNSFKDLYKFSGKLDCQRVITSNACYNIPQDVANWATFQKGQANMSSSLKNCFDYKQKSIKEVQTSTNDYGSFTSYNIEGIYDALYRTYQRLENQLSQRLLKIIFKQDVGWQTKQDLIIRDANKKVDLGEYLYKGSDKEYNSNMCVNVDFFENDIAKAGGSNTKTKYEYYSWLGYLDIMQEWMMAYTNNSSLPGDKHIANPFYDLADSSKPNNTKKEILMSGVASQFISYPLLSCDQVNICKQYSNTELYNSLRSNPLYTNLQDEDIHSLADEMCPFSSKLPQKTEFTCIDDYNSSSQDKMATYLCSRGYNLGADCKAYQCSVQSSSEDDSQTVSSTLTNLDQLNDGLVSLINKIESNMCINPGVMAAMLEREHTSTLSEINGNLMEKLYPRAGGEVAWGPANFTDIAWIGSGFGKLGSDFFEKNTYSTKKCLDALGLSYDNTNPNIFESPGILDRTYLGYALCGAAAKLKYDSGTGSKCTNWSEEEIQATAKGYLGACEQFGRQYCGIFSQTICNTYAVENPVLCSGVLLACNPENTPTPPSCDDGIIRLAHPLKDKASDAVVTQGYGDNNHNAIDYGISEGSEVYAAAPGVVLRLQKNWQPCPANATLEEKLMCDSGNFITIHHKSGLKDYWTVYEHLSSVNVEEGDVVNTGDLIGLSGNTGNSSGPHLHFELRLTDCYDGYGSAPLGSCSSDPSKYILPIQDLLDCKIPDGQGESLITGDFACPIQDPQGSGARIYQDENGYSPITGNSGGSHSLALQSLYHQHEQLPTDIRAPNAVVVAPVDGTVKNVVTPIETISRFGGGICDYIRLPDGNSANDSQVNMDIVNSLNLHQCTASGLAGKYCNSAGSFVYDPSIDDEGDFYYDGGFIVEILDDKGQLWRLVHMKNIQVQEGQKVVHGETIIGRVYDGNLPEPEWQKYSSRPKDGSSCMDSLNPHLHFAIISSNAADNEDNYFTGNTQGSTEWVKNYCKIN